MAGCRVPCRCTIAPPRVAPPGVVPPQVARPRTRFVPETDQEFHARRANVVAIRRASDDRVVAVIEILSPGNKSARARFQDFLDKAWQLRRARIHLLLVDLFPPGPRDPEGVHAAVWDGFSDEPFRLPSDQPLTPASYQCDDWTRASVEPIAVGDPLPETPRFLTETAYADCPLESTYASAFAELPERRRRVLEA